MIFPTRTSNRRITGELIVNNWWMTVHILLALLLCAPAVRAHSPHDHIEAFDMAPSREKPETDVMLIVVRANLWRSLDRGATWKRIVRGIDARWEMNQLIAVPTPEGPVWFLGTDGDGIFRSDDDGWTWRKMNGGLVQRKVRTMAAGQGVALLATTDARVYAWQAGEADWRQIAGHPEKVSLVWTDSPDRFVFGDQKGRIFESNDGGKAWSERFHTADPAGVSALHLAPDGQWLAGYGTAGVFTGKDLAGVAARNSGLSDQRITHFASGPDAWFAVSWNDGPFRSADAGATWERRAGGLTTDEQGDRRGLPQFTVMRRAADSALFLAGYDGLFRSTDDGVNWTEIPTLPQTLLIDFDISPGYANDQQLVGITYWKGAARSRDGGETWEAINGDLAPSYRTQVRRKQKGSDEYSQIQRFHSITHSPDYARDQTLFAGLRNWFLISDDGGDSWDQVELTRFADGEDVIPDRIVFSSKFDTDGTLLFCCRFGEGETRGGGVFLSTDRGRTFKLVHQADGKYMQSLVLSPGFGDDGIGFLSSAQGAGKSKVFRTSDRGATWQDVTGDLEFADFGAELAVSRDFVKDRTVWAGTEKGLWRSRDGGDGWERLKTDAFSEDGFIDLVHTAPDGSLVITVKGEGHFRSTDGGQTFAPFAGELFAENHQFNRPWSYSPGRMIQFAPGFPAVPDIFAMNCESFFRLDSAGRLPRALPFRESVALVGEANVQAWWGMVISLVVAGVGAAGMITVLTLRWRQRRAAANRP